MLWVILAAIGILFMMVVILNNNVLKFQNRIIEWARALSECITGSMPGDPGVQVAADELVARNVKFMQRYKILEGAAIGDIEEILDMSLYEKYNLVMIERRVPLKTLLEVFEEADLDVDVGVMDEEEILKMLPPIFCSCADIRRVTYGEEAGTWIVDYKANLEVIDLEDDEE